MTTQVTKYIEIGAVIGANVHFATNEQIKQWINSNNAVELDENYIIKARTNFVLPNDTIPPYTDATHRYAFVPDDGKAFWQMATTQAQKETMGVEVEWNIGQYGFHIGSGLDFFNMRIRIKGSANNQVFFGRREVPIDNDVQHNYIIDETTNGSGHHTLGLGVGYSYTRFDNNRVVVVGSANKVFMNNGLGHQYYNNTFVGRGLAAGNMQVSTQQYFGGALRDTVFINCGPTLALNTTISNSYSNTTPTAGAVSGVTVVSAAGALVEDTSYGFVPSANSPLIGNATDYSDNKYDGDGKFRGPAGDIGAVQRTAYQVPVPSNATIANIDIEGRTVRVDVTLSSVATSGVITLHPSLAGANPINKEAIIDGLTAYAVFPLTTPQQYAKASAIMTNAAGLVGTSSGVTPFTVNPPPLPTATVTTVTRQGRDVIVNFTWTGAYPHEPINAKASLTAGNATATTKSNVVAILYPNGTGTVRIPNNTYGIYSKTTVFVTNMTGTGSDDGAGISLPSPEYAIGAALTDISFQNKTGAALVNEIENFGQPFEEGHLPVTGAAVSLRAPNGTIIPCQLDIHSVHGDNSVRHASLTAVIPNLPANSTVKYDIIRAATGPTGTAITPTSFPGFSAEILLTETGIEASGPIPQAQQIASAAAKLAAGDYITHLSGPIAGEFIVQADFKAADNSVNPDLAGWFHICMFAGQKARVSFITEHSWVARNPDNTTMYLNDVGVASHVYRLSCKVNGATVYTRTTKGYQAVHLNHGALWGNYSTGVPNDSTVYNATVNIDGVNKTLSIMGTAMQNFDQLRTQINLQLDGVGVCHMNVDRQTLEIHSVTSGANSKVLITYGTLFPILKADKLFRPMVGDEVIHHPRKPYRVKYWVGMTAPVSHIIHNKNYLIKTRALPTYDGTLVGSPTEIARVKGALLGNMDFGANGVSKPDMGDVGFAPGIGIFPEWAAMWAVTQDEDAKWIMLQMGDQGTAWPMHYRDKETKKPISFAKWPKATLSPNPGDSNNPSHGHSEKLPFSQGAANLYNDRNYPKVTHLPDFFTLPWLITGDYFYAEGLAMHQMYTVLVGNAASGYRDSAKNYWFPDQARGQAWMMRHAIHAYHFLPTNYPTRSDIAVQVAANLDWYNNTYVVEGAPWKNNLGGAFAGHYGIAIGSAEGPFTAMSTFMDDHLTGIVGRALELGYSEWAPFFHYKAQYVVGRLTSPGFCFEQACHIVLNVTPIERAGGSAAGLFKTFAEIWASTFSQYAGMACGSDAMRIARRNGEGERDAVGYIGHYPDTIGGYVANMHPALSYAVTFGAVGADDARLVFLNRTLKPNYNLGPHFAIEPRVLTATEPGDPEVPVDPPVNNPPTFSGNIATITGVQGTAIGSVNVSTKFSDTDQIAFSKAPGVAWPAGINISAGGGDITGTPTVFGSFAGLKVRATDTAGNVVDSNPFTMSITAATVVVEPPPVPTTPVFPTPDKVVTGTKYGPNGVDYTGTYVASGSGPSAVEIANAVWTAEMALSIPNFIAVK